MSILVKKAGLLTSLQDLGRQGYRSQGIPPGGAMDKYSMQLANFLVGNKPGEAALEIHSPGPELFFEKPALIAFAGADFEIFINQESIPSHYPVLVPQASLCRIGKAVKGGRLYLAIAQKLSVPALLGSKSTLVNAKMGGFQGRSLLEGDQLPFENPWRDAGNGQLQVYPWGIAYPYRITSDLSNELAFIPGKEWEEISSETQSIFLNEPFTIDHQSNRMGYALKGPILKRIKETELLSRAVTFGTIQLLPTGQMIVLMAEHQTTGGYPQIAHIIQAHLPLLAQLSPGTPVRFRRIELPEAERLWIVQQQLLKQLQIACNLKSKLFIKMSL